MCQAVSLSVCQSVCLSVFRPLEYAQSFTWVRATHCWACLPACLPACLARLGLARRGEHEQRSGSGSHWLGGSDMSRTRIGPWLATPTKEHPTYLITQGT